MLTAFALPEPYYRSNYHLLWMDASNPTTRVYCADPVGNDPTYLAFQARANPSQLEADE